MRIKMRKTEENEKTEIRNMQNEKAEKQSKNPETLAAVHTHTHTGVLKNRKNKNQNVGRNDNINKYLGRGERKSNNRVYINKNIKLNYTNSGCYNEQNNIKPKKKVIKMRIVFLMALLVVVVIVFMGTRNIFKGANILNRKLYSNVSDENKVEQAKEGSSTRVESSSLKGAELQESKVQLRPGRQLVHQ